jgi:alkaline phosphatase
MNKSFSYKLIAILFTSFLVNYAAIGQTQSSTKQRNVILIIGDGMDDQQITIARNYLKGAKGQLLLDTLPVRSSVQVLTVAEDSPEQAVYVAGSANSGTAIATGEITSRGRIATSAKTDKDISTIAEQAKQQGFSVGIVTTASVTDATPASFMSHISQRSCENSSMMVNAKIYGKAYANCSDDLISQGGLGSIAEQIAAAQFDVVLGGGQKHFAKPTEADSGSILAAAENNQYHVINTVSELSEIIQLPASKKILGLFSSKHLPTKWQGENGRVAEKAKSSLLNRLDWRIGEATLPEPMKCEANPSYIETPTLKQMTTTAIERLSKNPKGFFLMVESASIDKQSHLRNPCGSIGELDQLEESIAVALEFAKSQPNTLILVTADHGQAAQLVPNGSLYSAGGVPIFSPGHVARLITNENSIMAINYATNDYPYEEHTGVNVPLFANGQGHGLIAPMIRQTDIYQLSKKYLNLD